MTRAAEKLIFAALVLLPAAAFAQIFQLPTANRAIFERGGEEKYFVGTTGKSWTSGTFGGVRSGGLQMHEGIDIRCLQRDRKGEPTDPVLATADGTVVYLNAKPQLSNYGIYLILRHRVEGLEIYSLYAHLSAVRAGLKAGMTVAAGEAIATLGRTTNTRERIAPERAHLHFELNLLVNERFAVWHEKALPDQRNDHGNWNGKNFLGLDPRGIFHRQKKDGKKFSLVRFIQSQPELCRVLVRKADFPWLRRYAALVDRNPVAEKEGIAGYELSLNFNGIPVKLTPRGASEIKGKAKFQLLSVNEAEQKKNPARKLVAKKNGQWELTTPGLQLLELLTY
ncbi:MAG: M23 family metallopeptidase [Verrucomicrobia bacterium]|nr:M23 family metallopeptidase [Verrucomicrobiota bacterium]